MLAVAEAANGRALPSRPKGDCEGAGAVGEDGEVVADAAGAVEPDSAPADAEAT